MADKELEPFAGIQDYWAALEKYMRHKTDGKKPEELQDLIVCTREELLDFILPYNELTPGERADIHHWLTSHKPDEALKEALK